MTTFEKIPELIRDAGLITWVVKSSEKGDNNVVFRTDENVSFEQNIERMRRVMACYTGDYFVLIGYDNPKSTRGGCRWDFSNSGRRETAAPAVIGTTGHSDDEMQAMINLAVGKVEQKYQELELKRREEDLKARENDYNTGLGLALSKLGAAWKHANPRVAVSGIGEPPIKAEPQHATETDEDSERAADLLNRWLAIDGEAIDVLEKIVGVAETGVFNAGMMSLTYEQLKSTLLNK